MKDINFFSEQG